MGPGVLAVNVFRVTQEEKRHHGKESVPYRVYAALLKYKKSAGDKTARRLRGGDTNSV